MNNSGRDKFKKNKKFIFLMSRLFSLLGIKINRVLFDFFRNTDGKLGLLLRYIFLKNISKNIGDNVSIQPGVYLFNTNNLTIGNNVSIHPMCYIDAEGGIFISDNVSIAHSSSLISANHTWKNKDLPIKYNELDLSSIYINQDVWIGCGVRILAGVTISRRSVVAAGAVVNKSFSENSLIGGVPSKIIKSI